MENNKRQLLDILFAFPTVVVDGDNEQRKMSENRILGSEEEQIEYDMIFGEAEYPYSDFIGIEDRWLPSRESLDRALNGKFDACLVTFAEAGQFLVPWNKKRFKKKIAEFAQNFEEGKLDGIHTAGEGD